MHDDIQEIKRRISPVLKKAGVRRSSLFGSCARGSMSESSDIDVLVELPDAMSLLQYVRLKQDLEDAVGRPVDLVEYKSVKPRLQEYILSNQVSVL